MIEYLEKKCEYYRGKKKESEPMCNFYGVTFKNRNNRNLPKCKNCLYQRIKEEDLNGI